MLCPVFHTLCCTSVFVMSAQEFAAAILAAFSSDNVLETASALAMPWTTLAVTATPLKASEASDALQLVDGTSPSLPVGKLYVSMYCY